MTRRMLLLAAVAMLLVGVLGAIANPTFTVTFDANGGMVTPTSRMTGADGMLASLPTPTRADHTFSGWFTDETGETQVTTSTTFDADATIYARWVFTVSFDRNGGSGVTPANITIADITQSSTPGEEQMPPTGGFTRSGFVNDGKWYSRSTSGNTNQVFTETFENETNGWIFVNGTQTNKWMIGTATRYAGSSSAYISNNNSANSYTVTSASVVHMYRDITFPVSSADFALTFFFKGMGETNYDDMTVRYSNTNSTPVAGSIFTAGTLIGTNYLNNSTWSQKTVALPAAAFSGRTMRLVFTWRNDASAGTQPPAAIDNISITAASSWPVYTYTEFVFGGGGTAVTANTTLYLQWIPAHTVTFNANGGTVTPTSGRTGINGALEPTSLPTPTRANYTFNGWFTAAVGGTEVTTNTVFGANAMVYAQWMIVPSFIFEDFNVSRPSGWSYNGLSWVQASSGRYLRTAAGFGSNGSLTIPNVRLGTNAELSFYSRIGFEDDSFGFGSGGFDVHISTNNGSTWTQLDNRNPDGGYDGVFIFNDLSSYANLTVSVRISVWTGILITPNAYVYLDDIAIAGTKYTITFDANGGNVSPRTGTTGMVRTSTASLRTLSLPTPIRAGYAFNGWFTAAIGGEEVTANTEFNANTVIYAQWVSSPIVTFNANGGTVTPASNTTGEDWMLASLPMPTRPGYVFGGWFTAATGGTAVTTNRVYTASTVIYAQWVVANATFIFENFATNSPSEWAYDNFSRLSMGGLMARLGGSVTIPDVTLGMGAQLSFRYDATVDMSNVTSGVVNGYNYYPNLFIRTGDRSAQVTGTFSGAGNRRTYTYDLSSYAEQTVTVTISVPNGTNIYVYLDDVIIVGARYAVTFDANGGTVTPRSDTTGTVRTSVATLRTLGSLPRPTRTGYAFNGWFTAATGGEEVTTNTEFNAHTVIYAQWSPIYNVKLDANGGTVVTASITTGTGSTLASLPTPTREGHTFNGWFTEETGGTEVTTNTVYNENTTIYAQWVQIYTITFDANGGAVTPASGQTGADRTLALLPTPTRSGHIFDGWFTSSASGTEVTIDRVYSGNTTIYAQWTATVYTVVTFNATGGMVSPTFGLADANGILESLPTPTRTGYTFDGWFTEEIGGDEVTLDMVYNEDAVIYAQWSAITYPVTFGADENGSITATVDGEPIVSGALVPHGQNIIFTAIPNDDYEVNSWTLNGNTVTVNTGSTAYTLTNVTAGVVVTVSFERVVSVAEADRSIPPTVPEMEVSVISPVVITSGEFAAGPNPVNRQLGVVNFFWQGKSLKNGTLFVYDASGNAIGKVNISDNTAHGSQSKRVVGSWDLTDSRGRPVADGTYLVRGTVKTINGKRERVSLVLGVR